jgi:hypothetical protein
VGQKGEPPLKKLLSSSLLVVLLVGVGGCCKEQPDKTDPLLLPEPKPGQEKVLTPAGETALPAPTPAPTTASTDAYQSNGFPEVMPSKRTPAPNVSEWSRAPVITTKKFPDGCQMKFVREWLKINCSKDTDTPTPLRIANITGLGSEGADYFKFEKEGKVLDIVVRTKDGKGGSALFVTDRGSYRVGYNWPYRAPFPSTIFE